MYQMYCYKLDAYAGAGSNLTCASRVPCPCGLTVIYEISLPFNLASQDMYGIENKPTILKIKNILSLSLAGTSQPWKF